MMLVINNYLLRNLQYLSKSINHMPLTEQRISLPSATEHVSAHYAAPRHSIPQPYILFAFIDT